MLYTVLYIPYKPFECLKNGLPPRSAASQVSSPGGPGCSYDINVERCQPQLLGFVAAFEFFVWSLEIRLHVSRGPWQIPVFFSAPTKIRFSKEFAHALLLGTARRADAGANQCFDVSEVGVLGFPTPIPNSRHGVVLVAAVEVAAASKPEVVASSKQVRLSRRCLSSSMQL